MKYLLGIILLVITFISSAQVYQGGTIKVQSMRFSPSAVFVRFSPALNACEGGNQYRMHAKFPLTQLNSNELTSALLTAYTSGQTLQYVWVSNEGERCSNSRILNLDMIEFTYK